MALTKVTLAGAIDTIKEGWTKFNDLIDDLLSTSNGLGASQIGIEDSAGNMAAANVEAALAEVYSDHGTTKTLAETFDENPDTTVGLTWGYKAGAVRLDNVVTSISAGTVSLTDDATNYVELDASDTTVKRNTTGFTNGRIPLRQIVCASGAQTTSTDKRAWFSAYAQSTATTQGIVELATNAETVTGTDTARACTAANLTAKMAAPGAIGGTTPSTGVFTSATVSNEGLHMLDTNASHDLIMKPGSDLTADRILTVTTGDAARTVTLSGDLSIAGATTVSAFGATLTDDADAATALGTLGLSATAAEINTGCDGIANPPIAGDATAGRVLRVSQITISNATEAAEIKCYLGNKWNGNIIALTDNIGKNETVGDFTLAADGETLTIEASGLTGNCVAVLSSVVDSNASGTAVAAEGDGYSNDIRLEFRNAASGAGVDLTTLVDTGTIMATIAYITDA